MRADPDGSALIVSKLFWWIVILYYVPLSLDSYISADLDHYSTMMIDYQPYLVYVLKNVGRQALPVVCKAVPDSPFVKSNGIIMLQPGQTVVVEAYRLEPEQLINFRNRSLVLSTSKTTVINQ